MWCELQRPGCTARVTWSNVGKNDGSSSVFSFRHYGGLMICTPLELTYLKDSLYSINFVFSGGDGDKYV